MALVGMAGLCEFVWPSSLTRPDARRVVAIAAACGVALLINPYGWGLFQYMYENLSVPSVLSIAELRPAYWPAYRAFFVFAGLTALVMLSMPRRLTLWEVTAAVVCAGLGFRFLRLTPLLVFVAAPMMALRLTAWTARGIDGRAIGTGKPGTRTIALQDMERARRADAARPAAG